MHAGITWGFYVCNNYHNDVGSTPGSDTVQLKDILIFATDGSLPLASTCSNELTLPKAHDTYYEFSRAFVEGVVGCEGLFDQPKA